MPINTLPSSRAEIDCSSSTNQYLVTLFKGRGFLLYSDICNFSLTIIPGSFPINASTSSGNYKLTLPGLTLTLTFNSTSSYNVATRLNIYKKVGDTYQLQSPDERTISNIPNTSTFSITSTSQAIQFKQDSAVKGALAAGNVVRNQDTFSCEVVKSDNAPEATFSVLFFCELSKKFAVECEYCSAIPTNAYPYDQVKVTSQHGSLHKAWSIEGLPNNCYIDQPPSDADETFSFYMPPRAVSIVATAFQPFKPSIDVSNSKIKIRTLIEDDTCTSISLNVASGELRAKSFYEEAGAIRLNCDSEDYSVYAEEFIEFIESEE